MNLDKLISENINRYVNKIIKENEELDNEHSPQFQEFMNHISELEELNNGENDKMLECDEYGFNIKCYVNSSLYEIPRNTSWNEPPEYDEGGSADIEDIEIICLDEDDEEVYIEPSELDMMKEALKQSATFSDDCIKGEEDFDSEYWEDKYDSDRDENY